MVESKTSIVTKGTVDTSKTTTDAYSRIKAKNLVTSEQKPTVNLGKDDVTWKKSPVFKTKVKAWTQDDNQVHKYFHSLSIDVQIQDFTGTAELRCPYDSDLIEYCIYGERIDLADLFNEQEANKIIEAFKSRTSHALGCKI